MVVLSKDIKNSDIAAFYNDHGTGYSDSWSSVAKQRHSAFEKSIVVQAIQNAQALLSSGRRVRVLEIGCGTGRIAEAILAEDVAYYGIDISSEMVSICENRFSDNQNVTFAVYDIANGLPTEWGTFDVIVAIRVLYYTGTWQANIRQAYSLLNDGGYFVFSFPNKYSSTIVPKIVFAHDHVDYQTDYKELHKLVLDSGYSEVAITGYARLLDTFYDLCNSITSSRFLHAIERMLRGLLGNTFLARMFYVTCKK